MIAAQQRKAIEAGKRAGILAEQMRKIRAYQESRHVRKDLLKNA